MNLWWACALTALLANALYATAGAAETPSSQSDLATQIRMDHPRLFFNRDTWPMVLERATGPANEWYKQCQSQVDSYIAHRREQKKDLGVLAAKAAFCYLTTQKEAYLQTSLETMKASMAYYEKCYQRRRAVNWYGHSRTHWLLAWDWLYNYLDEPERDELISRFVKVLGNVLATNIYRENKSAPTTGYYGVTNCMWYAGVTALGEKVDQELVAKWLKRGYSEHMDLLAYRRQMAGDDGSPASATVGYSLGAYPDTEYNFFYSLASATGRQIASQWLHPAMLPNFVLWNWVSGGDGRPREYGYGDTPHTTNHLPTRYLYAHMTNIRHFYGRSAPKLAAAAHAVQKRVEQLPQRELPRYWWFIQPFCQDKLERSPGPLDLSAMPQARHFEGTGQTFMRSDLNADATYALFVAGGKQSSHRQYDMLHFTIYKHGFQAMDTGTRWSQFANGRHLANYFGQTVAHNCVLIHLPDEPPARYWGMPPGERMTAPNYGGQDKRSASRLEAFETNNVFTYVAGDATDCYTPRKCNMATRQMVFIMPDIFVVFDRVVSTKPDYRKDWLLHTGSKPKLDGTLISGSSGKGKLFCRSLLPEKADIRIVGGKGKEFLTGKQNWDIETVDGRNKLSAKELAMIGQWRLEISPHEPATEDVFLHVIQVGPESLDAMVETELVRDAQTAGVRLSYGGRNFQVRFAATGKLAGHITAEGNNPINRPLTDKVTAQSGILAR